MSFSLDNAVNSADPLGVNVVVNKRFLPSVNLAARWANRDNSDRALAAVPGAHFLRCKRQLPATRELRPAQYGSLRFFLSTLPATLLGSGSVVMTTVEGCL